MIAEPCLEAKLRPDGVINVHANGKLTPAQYEIFVPQFEALVAGGGRYKMLTELGPGFTGWTLAGLLADLKFDLRFRKHFGPTAIVGHRRWQRVGTIALKPFYRVPLRFFAADQLNEAERWLASHAGRQNSIS